MAYRIKAIRKSKGMSQTALSKASNVSRATIWKLETGADEVTTSTTLLRIAKALDVPVGDLFLDQDVQQH